MLVDGDMESPPIADESDELVDSVLSAGVSGASTATIFMPRDSPVLAGMNNVVTPFLLIMVRCGWYDAQHDELVSPVEYSCRASAKLSCSSSISPFFSDKSKARTSELERTVRGMMEFPLTGLVLALFWMKTLDVHRMCYR